MTKRIRVIQMVYNFHIESGGGGITRAAIDIAQNLDPNFFDVSIVGLGNLGTDTEKRWIEQLNREGIRAETAAEWDESYPYRSFMRAIRALIIDFSNQKPHIVHSHSEFTDIAAILLKLTNKSSLIMRTVHYGYSVEWRNRPLRRALLTNLLYPILFNVETGINHTMQERLDRRKVAGLLKKKALFISGAVNLERFQKVSVDKTAKRKALGIPNDALLIGCVGRLAEQKGHTYLLQAAEFVVKSMPGAYFLIVGDGPLEAELKKQARDLGIQEHVIFTGGRSDIEELFACMDLYAMASLWEGLPISVMESMASKVPVVTTDIAGCRDLIVSGENGWLVPPADSRAMSQAILRLLDSVQLRVSLAIKAFETVQNYSVQETTNRYAATYKSLIHNQ